MTLIIATFSLGFGLLLLIKGGGWLVEGASSLARRMHISDLVIGLTIVSFGTSAPEFLINIIASFTGSANLAIGNIIGSNIANTFLILGTTALIAPLTVKRSTVRKEIPFCLLASVLLFIMTNERIIDGYPHSELSRSDGLVFLSFLIIFLVYVFGLRRRSVEETQTSAKRGVWLALALLLAGLVGLGVGGKLTVDGAIVLARLLGVSEKLVGLTIVALGTSLPELATSLIAAKKGNMDIAIGNVIGSNIFNIFWILGASTLIKPLAFDTALNTDIVVVIISIIMLFLFVQKGRIHKKLLCLCRDNKYILSRLKGGTMLAMYFVYIGYISWRG